MFEKFQSPAMYIANSACLSSFSAARSTSLVVDMGASGITISPVVDGYVLRKSVVSSVRGGDWMDNVLFDDLSQQYTFRPWYESNDAYKNILPRVSYRDYHVREIIRDIKQWMFVVPIQPVSADTRPQYFLNRGVIPPYELPDGTLVQATDRICSIPERIFFSAHTGAPHKKHRIANVPGIPPFKQQVDPNLEMESIQELIYTSIGRCDVDIRKELASNIILVGGCSCIDGIHQRLMFELTEVLPSSFKPRIVNLLPIEKVNSCWIGGSILSICGTFQQMWVGKSEYEEFGVQIAKRKFV